jgi:hypothetical protein
MASAFLTSFTGPMMNNYIKHRKIGTGDSWSFSTEQNRNYSTLLLSFSKVRKNLLA